MEVGDITPPTPSSRHSMISLTPESSCSYEGIADGGQFTPHSRGGGNFTAWVEIERNKLLCDLQQMVNRYNDCFCLLKDAITGVKILRQENLQLEADNLELEILIEDKEKKEREKAAAAAVGVSPVIRSVKGKEMIGGGGKVGSDLDSPGGSGSGSGSGTGTGTGSGSGSGSGSDGARKGGMPKCISIRSTKFLAAKHPQSGGAHRLRLPTPPVLHGGDEKEEEVELEVYNQGTMKTELCNKWGETRWCPYGTRCQFAHGIEELKPVIRHPRYKTQQCRMMGAGGDCPYGHRCHFRHALPNPKQ